VSHIIKELSPTEEKANVLVQKTKNIGPDDAGSDTKVAKIQGTLFDSFPERL
jgi:kinesin family protein C2/C3